MKVYIKNCFICNRTFSDEVMPAAKIFDESDDGLRDIAICTECLKDYKGYFRPIVSKVKLMHKKEDSE